MCVYSCPCHRKPRLDAGNGNRRSKRFCSVAARTQAPLHAAPKNQDGSVRRNPTCHVRARTPAYGRVGLLPRQWRSSSGDGTTRVACRRRLASPARCGFLTAGCRPPEGCMRRHRASAGNRSEEHTSELQSLMRISYAVFCLKKKKIKLQHTKQDMRQNKNSTHSDKN